VKTVIPSHGPVCGPELLLRNAAYLDSLERNGHQPDVKPQDARFYVEAHRRNKERAAQLSD
jgi:hypothetical protein